MATYLEQSLKQLEIFEGSIPWMYRDTAGKVTVGVGLMLPDAAAAARLGFEIDGRAATEAEITAEFERVDALPMGRPALFYRRADAPELPQFVIGTLLLSAVSELDDGLKRALAGYAALPDTVKLALLDMAYNLGLNGLLKGFPKMIAAVEAGNWAQAAANCERIGTGAARNQWTRQMLLTNMAGTLHAQGDGMVKQLAYGVVGMAAALWSRFRRQP
jgi:GH24 family phage-related lysozyme (muramidase)